jgi:beta-lactamase regulating signal transducer with metallopeptidase domain
MITMLLIILTNAAMATLLFLVVMAIHRVIHHPAILHWLLVLVLIKLVTPPFWTPTWSVLPAEERAIAAAESNLKSVEERLDVSMERAPAAPDHLAQREVDEAGAKPNIVSVDSAAKANAPAIVAIAEPSEDSNRADSPVVVSGWYSAIRISPLAVVFAAWAIVACYLAILSMVRVWRWERCLRNVEIASGRVQAMVRELAAELGLGRVPTVVLAPGDVSPMLWVTLSRARIMVPRELYEALPSSAQRSLLLHELVHYRRGDHWVRYLELVVTHLYWWFPVAWLIRREIRHVEELACDAEVVARLPKERRAYAEMLVNVTAMAPSRPTPMLASGIGAKTQIEERVRKIMRSTIQVRVSGGVKLIVAAVAMVVLPLAPVVGRAQRAEEKPAVAAQVVKTEGANEKVDWLRGTGETLEIRIAGEIVDQSGKPAEGAKLVVQYLKNGEATDLEVSRDGQKFEVWVPLATPQWSFFGFYGSSADGKQMIAKRIAHRQLRQSAIDGMPLQLQPFERTMEIKVVDKGSPVEGASVFVDSRARDNDLAVTDKDGIARFGMSANDEPSEITAWTADHRIGGYQFSRQPTRDAKLAQHTIELSPCQPQKVRFLQDADGKPVEGIGFCLYGATPTPYYNYVGLIPASTMKTDAQGEAIYEWYPDWPQHHFYVDRLDQNWVRVSKEKIAADGAIEVRVKKSKLAQRQPITGELTSFDGKPGGYFLEFRSFAGEEESRMDVLYAVTDSEGKFTISVLPGAVYYGHVDDERYFSDIVDWLPYDSKTNKSSSPKFSVKEGVPVEVFVGEGPNKKPIANQYVSLFNEHSHAFMEKGETRRGTGSHQWWVITDENGIGRGFARADRELKAAVNQLDWRMEKTVQPKDGRFERIELHRPIAGRLKVKGQLIIPAELGSSLEVGEMQYGAMDGQSMDHDQVKVDAEGRFAFETASPLFGVYASTKDKKAAIAQIVESSAIGETLSLQLDATGEYQGRILDEAGKPKADYPVRATIGLTSKRKSETGSPTWFFAQVSSAKTDAEGNFTLAGIPFGIKTSIYGGAGDDNGRIALDEVALDAGEKRPKAVHRLSAVAPSAPDKRPPLKTQFENALRDAKLGGWRTMVVTYEGTPENREFVTQQLYNYDDNNDVSGFMHVFYRTGGESVTADDQAFAESMNWPAPGEGKVFACAMDESGKELGRTELDIKDTAAPEKASKFMHEFAPQPADARKKWDEAFALAAKTNRKVWVRVSQRFCGPCLVLNRWLDDQKELIEKDYVLLKVCNVRDLNGSEVAARFWDYKSGNGVPFHAIFDPSGAKIIDSAGPLGNIGAPSGYEGGKHLRKMLMDSRKNLTEEEIDKLIKSLPE